MAKLRGLRNASTRTSIVPTPSDSGYAAPIRECVPLGERDTSNRGDPMRLSLITAIVSAATACIAGCAGEYKAFDEAKAADTAAAYTTFLEQYPDAVNASEARNLLDTIDWEAAEAENSASAYEEYTRMHPDGRYADKAEMAAPKQAWAVADLATDTAVVEAFIESYGKGSYSKKANARLDLLNRQAAHLEISPMNLEVIEEGRKWKVSADILNSGAVDVVECVFRIAWKDRDGVFARSKEWGLVFEPQEGVDAKPELTRPLGPGETRRFEFTFVASEACEGWPQTTEATQLDVVKLKISGG
jgi:hypothetical protein